MPRLSFIVMDPPSAFGAGDGFRDVLQFLRDVGYEGVELNITKPAGFDEDTLERWLDEIDIVLPSFLTGGAYVDGLCLSSPISNVRERAVERLIGYIGTARRFGAILVVGLMQGLQSDEPNADVANRRIAGCLLEVCAVAETAGVDVVMEPVNHLQVGFNNTVAEVLALMDVVGSPALRPMVDTIHMNIEETSLTQPILDLGPQLRHVHLCESNAGHFGTGHVDFAAVIRALGEVNYADFSSVKVYRGSNLREDAQSSMSYLRSLEIR